MPVHFNPPTAKRGSFPSQLHFTIKNVLMATLYWLILQIYCPSSLFDFNQVWIVASPNINL